jgi:hypothetical protein
MGGKVKFNFGPTFRFAPKEDYKPICDVVPPLEELQKEQEEMAAKRASELVQAPASLSEAPSNTHEESALNTAAAMETGALMSTQ